MFLEKVPGKCSWKMFLEKVPGNFPRRFSTNFFLQNFQKNFFFLNFYKKLANIFCPKSKFLVKTEILVRNRTCGKLSQLFCKKKFFGENCRNFGGKSSWKIFVKNYQELFPGNFGEKSSWKIFVENYQKLFPGTFSRNIFLEHFPGTFSRNIFQELFPGTFSRNILQELFPGTFSRNFFQEILVEKVRGKLPGTFSRNIFYRYLLHQNATGFNVRVNLVFRLPEVLLALFKMFFLRIWNIQNLKSPMAEDSFLGLIF